MLLRSFELPNLPFPASMLSIRIASMLFTWRFEPPNLPFLASMLSIRISLSLSLPPPPPSLCAEWIETCTLSNQRERVGGGDIRAHTLAMPLLTHSYRPRNHWRIVYTVGTARYMPSTCYWQLDTRLMYTINRVYLSGHRDKWLYRMWLLMVRSTIVLTYASHSLLSICQPCRPVCVHTLQLTLLPNGHKPVFIFEQEGNMVIWWREQNQVGL